MATTGLPDPKDINLYGAEPSDISEYQKSLQASVDALEQRYANPNWFNIAAGFFKPQLGGFAASLGSAAQAMGETVEKQRESQLPLAQMRAQLAASKIAMGQRASVADMLAKRNPNEPLTPEFVREVTARAPGSAVAQALKEELATQNAQRGLAASEQGNAIQRVQLARAMGLDPSPADLALLAAGSTTLKPPAIGAPGALSATPGAPGSTVAVPGAPGSTVAVPGAPGAPTTWTGKTIPPAQLDSLRAAANSGDSEAKDVLRAYNEFLAAKEPPLPQTVRIPNKPDYTDINRQAAIAKAVGDEAIALEKISNERYANLTNFTAPETLPIVQSAARTALTLMDEDPQRAERVLNLIRKAGPVAAAFNAGFSAQVSSSVGSAGGSLSFPVEAWLKAGLDPADQAYADKLANALMTLKAAGVKMSSVSPTALVNHPSAFGSVQYMNFDMGQTPAALYNSVKHFQINQDFLRDYAETFKAELKRVDPSSLAKLTDTFNSPKLRKLADSYQNVHSALDKAYSSDLAKKKQ